MSILVPHEADAGSTEQVVTAQSNPIVVSPTQIQLIGTIDPSVVPQAPPQPQMQSGSLLQLPAPSLPVPPSRQITVLSAPTISGSVGRATTAGPLTSISGVGWAGMDRNVNGGGITPPDTQLAVGNGDAVEEINADIDIYSATYGTALSGYPKDLKSWWCSAAGQGSSCTSSPAFVTDPRVYYDAASGRFFATILFVNSSANTSAVDLAVSKTSDPNGSWATYAVQPQASGVYDQPKLAVTGDKVTVTVNYYSSGSSGFSNGYMYVIQKSSVVAGASSAGAQVFNMQSRFNILPALALTGGNNQYAAYDSNVVLPQGIFPPVVVGVFGLITVTGTPSAGNVAESESDLVIQPFVSPSGAAHQNSSVQLDPGPADYSSVVAYGSTLLAGGTDKCGTNNLDCLRVDVVNLSNASVTQDVDVTGGTNNLLYPAMLVDGNGNGWVSWSVAGPSTYAYAAVAAWSGIPYNVSGGAQIYMALGTSDYCDANNNGQCQGLGQGGTDRWGDYAAMARDPSAGNHVWAAQEYGAAGTSTSPGGTDWETSIVDVSLS